MVDRNPDNWRKDTKGYYLYPRYNLLPRVRPSITRHRRPRHLKTKKIKIKPLDPEASALPTENCPVCLKSLWKVDHTNSLGRYYPPCHNSHWICTECSDKICKGLYNKRICPICRDKKFCYNYKNAISSSSDSSSSESSISDSSSSDSEHYGNIVWETVLGRSRSSDSSNLSDSGDLGAKKFTNKRKIKTFKNKLKKTKRKKKNKKKKTSTKRH